MTIRLVDTLASIPQYAEIFADSSLLQAMLDFEAALARAEASVGVIPPAAAEAITRAAKADNFDVAELRQQGLRAGTLSIPLVKMLRERADAIDKSGATFAHWGATSQDVSDTATVLLLRWTRQLIAADHARLRQALRRRSDDYANTVMLGRTLLQAAPPITLGLKIAGWYAALQRSWARLDAALGDALVLQFGGATGTLAALGDQAIPVARALAKELNLPIPEAPWHTHRDRFAAVVCACGIYVGSLGKMAKDISLLMQGEVAEAFEPGGDGRGGSSSMPHKRNPIACALALAAADRVPGYVASFLAGMPQEHERSVGGWHAEAATIARTIEDLGLALVSMIEVAEGLTVDAAKMRENIADTHGAIFAEHAVMTLSAAFGRHEAQKMVADALRSSAKSGTDFANALATMPQVAKALPAGELHDLGRPESYLGAAEIFRKQLLETDK
ncbi:MAG TPA: 3-carboxy-cis,cis-muconate cycloisomerase [Candidatus Acidoferrales bacterium]